MPLSQDFSTIAREPKGFASCTSVRGKLQHKLFSYGLEEADAVAIVEILESRPSMSPIHFSDPVDSYADIVFTNVWATVCTITDEWLAAHRPQHWARMAFTRTPSKGYCPC